MPWYAQKVLWLDKVDQQLPACTICDSQHDKQWTSHLN